jgi:hypothetical protein
MMLWKGKLCYNENDIKIHNFHSYAMEITEKNTILTKLDP